VSTNELIPQMPRMSCSMSVNTVNQAFGERYAIHHHLQHHGGCIGHVQSITSNAESAVNKPIQQELEANASCTMVHQRDQGEPKVLRVNISREKTSRGPLQRQTREEGFNYPWLWLASKQNAALEYKLKSKVVGGDDGVLRKMMHDVLV
jgi:hypothetical protein